MKTNTMKTKITTVLLLLFTLVGLSSCSKETVDNIERDTALNIIRTNKWFDVVKTVTIAGQADIRTTLVGDDDGDYMEFKKDGYAYIFNDGQTDSYAYSMPSNKKMIFDGNEFDIKENIIQTVARFTLQRTTATGTEKIEFRRR